jgi:hypothetical protein
MSFWLETCFVDVIVQQIAPSRVGFVDIVALAFVFCKELNNAIIVVAI